MKKFLLFSFLFLLCVPFLSAAADPAAGSTQPVVKIIMKDSSIVTGTLVGSDDGAIYVEKSGKALTLKKSSVLKVFDASTGKELDINGAATAAPAVTPAPAAETSGSDADKNTAAGKDQDNSTHRKKFAAAPGYTEPNGFFEIFAYGTLSNSYNIGTSLQNWMQDDVQSGSPAFANIGGTAFMGLDPDQQMYLGVGMSLNIPPSHSIWGSNLGFGNDSELVLNPYTISVNIPFRYVFKDSGFSLTLNPALIITVLTGYYTCSGNTYVTLNGYPSMQGTFDTNMGSLGMGFDLSLGAEYYFGMFGIGAKAGFRIEQAALNFNSPYETWSPTLNGQTVGIDLSGSYMTIGVMMKFGSDK
jgi:hypothetical protein